MFGINAQESETPVLTQRFGPWKSGYVPQDPKSPTGDHFKTMNEQAQAFAGAAGTPMLSQYQQELFAAHFYDDKYYGTNAPPITWGAADEATRNAFGKALEEAASSNGKYTVDDIIEMHAQQAKAMSGKKAKPPKLSNPEDVKANAQSVAPNVIGKRLDDATLNALVGKAEEMAQQQYTASDGQSAYYSSSPSQAWLGEQIRQLQPQTTAAFQTAGNVGSFLKMVDANGVFSAYHR
jgi:hypothetical protein